MSGVENSTYVGGLNQLNPESQDFISQGDDHLKLIKKCLLNTFPGFSRPIDGALFPWSQTPGAISVYAKFIEQTGRIGALEAFISPLHPDGAILRANNNLSDVADPAVARANLGIPAIADVLIKSQNLNDVPDKAAARINLGVPASADVLVKTQNLIDLQDVAIARQNLDVFSKAETFQKNLNLSDVVSAAVARTNLGAAAQADVLLKAQNFADVPDKAVARFNLDVPSNGDLVTAIGNALTALGAVTSVNGLLGDVVLDSADVGADPAGSATTAVNAHLVDADPHPQYTTVAEAAAAAPVQSVNGMTGAVTLEEEVLQYANLAAFPVSGSGATLYIAADTGLVYRWDGAAYVATGLQPIANQTILGNVSGATATPGALTQTQLRELVGVKAQFVAMTTPNQAIVLNADTSALHLLGPGDSGVTVDLGALNEGATLVVTSEVSTSPITFSKPAANHYLQGTNGVTASIQIQLDQFCIYTFTNVNGKILAGKSLSNAVSFVSTFTPAPVTSLANAGALHLPATIQRNVTTNTSAGGNSRGLGAVDFQRTRNAATQVASGSDSFLFPGDRNTASQLLTAAGGYQTSVSGAYSFGYSMYGSVTGQRAFLLGGASGTASGYNGGQIGGDGNITSGQRAVGIGGGGNAATAQDSVYIGGYGANVNVQGAHATGAGIFSPRKQRLVHIAGEDTTDATPKTLISSSQSDGVFAGNVLRSAYTNATLLVSGRVLGVSGAEHKAMRFDAVLVKTGATYTVGWQNFTVIDETAALTTASAQFVASSFGWELRVTGIAATAINWVSETEALEQVR